MGIFDSAVKRLSFGQRDDVNLKDLTTGSDAFANSFGGSLAQGFTTFNNQKQQLASYTDWVYTAARALAEQSSAIDLRIFLNRTGSKNQQLSHKLIYSPTETTKLQRRKISRIETNKSGSLIYRKEVPALEELETHPLLDLLNAPNDYMTRHDFFELTFLHLELTGDAFWVINRKGKTPIELWPLMPNLVSIASDKTHFVIGYVYTINGQQIPFAPEDVIHHKYANPTDFHRGMSTVMAASRTIDEDAHAADYNRKFFYNQAQPDAVLYTDAILDEKVFKRLKTEWSDTYGGNYNAHKTAILEDGLKYQPMVLTQRDMDFFNARNFNRDQILAMFGVPKSIIGLNEDVNRAAAETAEYTFTKGRIRPRMMRLTARITEDLAPQFGQDLVVSFTDPVPSDKEFELAERQKAVGSSTTIGWKTINETRTELGDDTVPGGDDLWVPNILMPIGQERLEPTPQERPAVAEEDTESPDVDDDTAESPDNDSGGSSSAPKPASTSDNSSPTDTGQASIQSPVIHIHNHTGNDDVKQLGLKLAAAIRKQREQEAKSPKVKAAGAASTKASKKSKFDAVAWIKTRNKITAKFELDFLQVAKKHFDAQKKEVLANIKERFSGKSVKYLHSKAGKQGLNNLFNQQASQNAWSVELTPVYENIGTDIGAAAMLAAGTDTNYDYGASAKEFFNQAANTVSSLLDSETNKLLKADLTEAVNAGKTPDEMYSIVENNYSALAGWRADRVARTESAMSATYSSLDAWKQSDVVGGKEWQADENPCPICADLDGTTLALDESWAEGGDGPPAHPNAVFAGSTFIPYGTLKQMVGAEYEGPGVLIKTSEDYELTIGPNHPMLTQRGLIKASQLTEDDYLVYDTRINNSSTVNPNSNLDQVPLVENAFNSIISSGVKPRVAPAAYDLHGDRTFCKGKVEIIEPANGLLPILDSCLIEQFRKSGFMGADMQPVVTPSNSSSNLTSSSVNLTTSSSVSSGLSCYKLIHIQSIQHITFKGWAFDASTETSLYNSGGFVVSNCECVLLPVLASEMDNPTTSTSDSADNAEAISETEASAITDLTENQDFLDSLASIDNSGPGDSILAAIYDKQGFNALPNVVSDSELQKTIDNGATAVFRGVSAGPKGQTQYTDSFMKGDTHFAGKGIYGDGTYLAADKRSAELFTQGVSMEKDAGAVMNMSLPADANTISFKDAASQMDKYAKVVGNADSPIATDVGRFAAAKGYDAIVVGTDSKYGMTVLLNRGIVNVSSKVELATAA